MLLPIGLVSGSMGLWVLLFMDSRSKPTKCKLSLGTSPLGETNDSTGSCWENSKVWILILLDKGKVYEITYLKGFPVIKKIGEAFFIYHL
jgi:hypothetical protein